MMSKRIITLLFSLLSCVVMVCAQEVKPSDLERQSEEEVKAGHPITGRHLLMRAMDGYAAGGRLQEAVRSGIKAVRMYVKGSEYQEAFDLLRAIDQKIDDNAATDGTTKPALHYQVSKERMEMYVALCKPQSAMDHINAMERHASAANDDSLRNDLLYTKAVYYYTFGMNTQGNAVFKEMASKLTASKEYDKVDKAYQTLIANGRSSNNANMVAQSYRSYIAWKDSVSALKNADEIGALKRLIATHESSIAEKDSQLSTRWAIIIGLCVLAVALAAALLIGAVVLLRIIFLNRKQKNAIKMANENNALKARFISNISAQLEPTLKRMDGSRAEVKALLDFSHHIQQLSELENGDVQTAEAEEIQIPQFCEGLINQIRGSVKNKVTLNVNAPKMSATIHKDYVAHILLHLLRNAAEYTPEGGSIWLDYKKRGARSHQFLVSDTGCGIPEEKREEVFKPFREVRDLTLGDGLGLPICKQMAIRMNGDLDIDTQFTKGTRFVLNLHT